MINFINENWKLLLEALILIASVVVFIVRKKPVKVIDTVKETVIRLLPYAITQAEASDKKGDDKKQFALDILSNLLREIALELTPELRDFAGEQLEILLSLPQKKGIKK